MAVCAVVVVGAAAAASQTPAYAPDHPRGLNIVYYDDKSAAPRWLIGFEGAPDEAFLKAQGFPAHDETYRQFGLIDAKGRFKPALDQMLPAPTLTLHEVTTHGGTTVARGTLRSGRGGFLLGVGIAPDSGVKSLRLDNQEVTDPARLSGNGSGRHPFLGLLERATSRLKLRSTRTAAPTVILYERSTLPDSGEARGLVGATTGRRGARLQRRFRARLRHGRSGATEACRTTLVSTGPLPQSSLAALVPARARSCRS